jgi:aminoglycoside phosphotransferase (APT) family kinase protein
MSIDGVAELLATHLPGYRVRSVEPAGAGLDNETFLVNGRLIVRFRTGDAAPVEREAHLLAAVAEISPLPVPRPVFAAAGAMAYPALPGVPLLSLPQAPRPGIAAELGAFLEALHAADPEHWAGLADVDVVPLGEWLSDTAESVAAVFSSIPPERRPAVEAFLAAAVPDGGFEPVFSHHDLGIEHVLVDPATSRITGVIDWTDAALVDPAYDFGLIFRDLGALVCRAELRERAVFYARCKVFEDLRYGLSAGRDAYVRKSLSALPWLFA